jgi:hypothetical protein
VVGNRRWQQCLQNVFVSKVKSRVQGTTTREQAFGAPEDKIDRRKGVLEGGRLGGDEGAGERVFEPRLQYGDANKV